MARVRPGSIPASISELSGRHLEDPSQNRTGTPDADLLRAVMEASGEGVVLCDAGGHVIMVNSAATRIVPGVTPGLPAAWGAVAVLFDRSCPVGESRRVTYGERLIRVRRETFGVAHHAWYLSDVTADHHGSGHLPGGCRRSEFLVEAGHRLSASLNTRRCARAAAELAIPFLGDVAMVLLPAEHRKARWLRATAGVAGVEEGVIAAAATGEVPGLVEALDGFPPVPSRWLDPAQAPGWLLPTGFGPAAHILVTPLPGTGAPAGALLLARRTGGPPFDEKTESLVRVFAARAGAAVSAAMLYQEQSATNAILTSDLLPPELPVLDHVELAGSLRASQQAGLIGGDFYDVYQSGAPVPSAPHPAAGIPVPGDTRSPRTSAGDREYGPGARGVRGREHAPLVILGDVCGKGARAAVLAGQIRHSLRTLLLLEDRPERLIELINLSLLASTAPDSYATLVLATLRPGDDEHLLVDLAVAGHPEPLILRADGGVEEVTARGSMLGALERIDLDPATVDLAPGELCLLYSDGITEAFGGATGREMYGMDRLKAALATCAGMPAEAVVQRLEQLTTAWLGHGEHDDRALLAIQAPLAGRRASAPRTGSERSASRTRSGRSAAPVRHPGTAVREGGR
ncbi:SpoIIE family protein phosphatase [Sphaerisporangium perillae]|uniref:SpoIIE family protein phosphatase n=1 Tax=Sphaerisporangium perillae TaxID=2935860 RepID=UPI00200E2E6F|nr:SpoIIE family protein phosphatase [Sphaerisporangium perillae]